MWRSDTARSATPPRRGRAAGRRDRSRPTRCSWLHCARGGRYGRHNPCMGKRARRRESAAKEPVSATDYADPDGNVLTLRDSLSDKTLAKLREPGGGAAANTDDMWRRRTEMLFERLAVRWEIAGLPLESQKELLGRYRMASQDEQRWVRETIDAHLERIGSGG